MVPSSQRKESTLDFLKYARDLQAYTIRKCVNAVPKRYTFYIGTHLSDSATRVYEYLKKGNSIYPLNQHEAQLRRDYMLKARIFLTESGKVVRKIYKRSVTRMRQRMKKFRRMVQDGRMKLETVRLSAQCWISYALNFDAIGTVKSIMGLIYDIFGCEEAHKILSVKSPRHGATYKKRIYISRYEKELYQSMKGA